VLQIIGMTVAMAIVLAIFTEYKDNGDSRTLVLGLPVVSVRQFGAHGWLALGQVASGVLVIGQAGLGVVSFVQVGAGALFGIGQLMFSLDTIGQVGVGVFTFIGQGGIGAQAIGQGVWRRRTTEYFEEVGAEVTQLLSWRGDPL
jgi:hypothetical protein